MTGRPIRDWYRARPGYWFRPKLFGWGAVPVTWQGWSLTLAVIAAAWPITRLAARYGFAPLALMIPLLIGFVWLCHAKTDGAWRWRWGDRD
ncbi:MAG: hypothetical protein V4574_09985 [Pseudomonadota bacterium]